MVERNFERLDENKDGKVSHEEFSADYCILGKRVTPLCRQKKKGRERDMKEIRYAALEHYKNCSSEQKQKWLSVFERLDENKDGKVSYEEVAAFLSNLGTVGTSSSSEVFADIDKDGDGYLDFRDAIVYYYMIQFRCICGGCGLLIKGMYYTCVECFGQSDIQCNFLSYDICVTCYRAREFAHEHSSFLDNHVLLRTREIRLKEKANEKSTISTEEFEVISIEEIEDMSIEEFVNISIEELEDTSNQLAMEHVKKRFTVQNAGVTVATKVAVMVAMELARNAIHHFITM